MDKAALYRRRRIVNFITLGISMLAVLFGLFWLVWILWTLFAQGLSAISLSMFTQTTPPPGSAGGLANAIFGSLLMSLLATVIGTPIGILAGTYVAEYGRRGWLGPATRFINDILLSAPSIVIGLFVYAVYVANVRHFSGWAGTFALALIVIPVVLKTTENMLRLVPDTMREAAAALGAPQWIVISFVTLRAARAGITTGILLAIARISGETAPLLFTALNNQFWSTNMDAPMANLPVVIFQFAMSPYQDWQTLAWGGALLITLSVLTLNIVARVMLALKTILARLDRVPTLIFDEVDAGIGGKVGLMVGDAMRRVAEHHQVFAITHLPQIAARAHHHIVVSKGAKGGVTTADITVVSDEERVREIARMLGGDAESKVSREHASELLTAGAAAPEKSRLRKR